MARKHSPAATPPSPWLFNAPVDLFVGAGAWTIPLLALTALASRTTGIDVALLFTALTLICNHPHYMATIHRAYTDRAALMQHRRYTIHVTILLAIALVLAHVIPVLRPLLFSAYVLWSPWHYTGQNFGLALLFARRNGVTPSTNDRLLLLAGFMASYGVWLLGVQSRPSDDPYVLSLAIEPALANAAALLLAGAMISCFSAFAIRLARNAHWRALAPTLLLCGTQLLWFVAPWAARLLGAETQPSIYYTTGALAFMHCAQYLWITTYFTRAAAPADAGWNGARYATVLGLGGIALFIPGPWIASSIGAVDLRESIIIFTAVVNLHHFVLDGALWKLRDRRVAAVLAGTAREAPKADRSWSPHLKPALAWGLASALVLVAAADLTQRALTRDSASDGALALAHAMNSHDTRVDVRRAALLARGSQDAAAIDVLRPVVATNPLHAPAQRLLGSLLLAEGRWSEADDHYEVLARRGGLDASGYVNLGVLRIRAGRVVAAEAAFRRALDLEPSSSEAHLNLAESLVRQQHGVDAIAHYARYLELADPNDERSQRVYLLAALKLAELHTQTGNPETALAVLERETRAAEHIQAWDLAMRGHAQTAQLLERSDKDAARSHYESAIQAAQRGGDSAREALLRARAIAASQ